MKIKVDNTKSQSIADNTKSDPKIGDLVRVNGCPPFIDGLDHLKCQCFFCTGNSNRVGVILGPGPRNSWAVMFDCGEWRLDMFDFARGEVEVINESR